MKYLDCQLKHLGQTDMTFYTRYKGHIQAIRSNSGNSGHSNRILNTGHTHNIITDTMDVIKIKKGKHLNTLEKYHVHKIIKDRLHVKDISVDTYNPIFEALHHRAAQTPHSPI
jgi:hypothetical protein